MSKAGNVYDTILKRVRNNVYTDKIPGERALSVEFGVNFKTANRAVSKLVGEGVLYRKRGEGTFVTPVVKRPNLTISMAFYKFTDLGEDPVFARFFAGANAFAKVHGLRLDVTTLPDALGDDDLKGTEMQERFVEQVLAASPDAVIYLGNMEPKVVKALSDDRPTVVVGEIPRRLGFDTVCRDIYGAVADAVRRFAADGHKQISFLTYNHSDSDYDLIEKQRGYLETMEALELDTRVLSLGMGEAPNAPEMLAADETPPTAVITAESTLGLDFLRNCNACGLTVPDKLSLISFDDGDVGTYTEPGMSSIHAFGRELASLAMQRLMEKLNGSRTEVVYDVIPCDVIERESTK